MCESCCEIPTNSHGGGTKLFDKELGEAVEDNMVGGRRLE